MKRLDDAELDAMDDALGQFWRGNGRPLDELFGGAGSLFAELTTTSPDPAELRAGETVGTYTIRQRIEAGGMGVVYEAEQADPRRRVALKLVRADRLDPQGRRRFEVEKRALGRLQHPAIARIYEAGVVRHADGEVPFFAMEWIDGMPLTRYSAARTLSVEERVRLLADVTAAVAHAHRHDVLHRDLKPSNVLVTDDGRPFVLDFGVARLLGEGERGTVRTDAGEIVGTVLYMSPEQLRGDSSVDFRTDVYALGVLLFELVTGRVPFDGRGAALPEIARQIEDDEPPGLQDVSPDAIDPDLEAIAAKCLEKLPHHRYASAAALETDLRRHLRGDRVSARRPSSVELLWRAARKHKALAATSAAAALFLLVGSVTSTWFAFARDQEARALVATGGFLERLVNSADLADNGRRDISLIEVLDREEPHISEEFAGQPEREAYLRNLFGKAYQSLGRNEEAVRQLDQAIELLDADPLSKVRLAACGNRAGALRELGRFAAAEAAAREAFEGARASLGEAHPHTLVHRQTLGLILTERGHAAEGETHLREALRLHDPTEANSDFRAASCAANFAVALNQQGRFMEAEEELRTILDELTRDPGPQHLDTLSVTSSWVVTLLDLAKYTEALDVARDLVSRCKQHLGEAHAGTWVAKVNLATVHRALAQYEDAEGVLLQVTAATDAGAPSHVNARAGLASIANARGRGLDALRMIEEALVETRKVYGVDHPVTLGQENDAATYLESVGRLDEAIDRLELVAANFERRLGRDHPRTLGVRTTLWIARQRRGDLDEAEAGLRDCLVAVRRQHGQDHPLALQAEGALLTVHEKLGRADRVIEKRTRLVDVACRIYGPRHPETSAARSNLALAFLTVDRWNEAVDLWRDVIEDEIDVFGKTHPAVQRSRSALAEALRQAGQLDEAEALYRDAIPKLETALGAAHPDLIGMLANHAVLLSDLGELQRAYTVANRCAEANERLFGPRHTRTLTSRANAADCLRALGRIGEARELFRATLATQEDLLGPTHDDVLTTRNNLALLELQSGRPEQALEEYERLIVRFTDARGDRDSRTLTALHYRGLALLALDRRAAAVDDFRVVTDLGIIELGLDHRMTLRSMRFHAKTLRELDQIDRATDLLAFAHDAAHCRYGRADPATAALLAELVLRRFERKEIDQLTDLLEDLVESYVETRSIEGWVTEVRRELPPSLAEVVWSNALYRCGHVHGATDPKTVTAAFELARVVVRANPRGAISLLEDVVHDRAEMHGERSTEVFQSLNFLGLAYLGSGALVRAEACFREAYLGFLGVLGDDHPDSMMARGNLAQMLAEMDRHAEAEPELRAVLEWSRTTLHPNSDSILVAEINLAITLQSLGKTDEATTLLVPALERARERPPHDPYRLAALREWADLLVAKGEHEEAIATLRELLDARRGAAGGDDAQVGDTLRRLGKLLHEVRGETDITEAEQLLREAVAVLDRTRSPSSLEALVARANLATVLYDRRQLEEAEEHFSAAYDGFGAVLTPEHEHVLNTALALASVRMHQRKFATAERVLIATYPHHVTRFGAAGDRTVDIVLLLAKSIHARSPSEAIAWLERAQATAPHERIERELARLSKSANE